MKRKKLLKENNTMLRAICIKLGITKFEVASADTGNEDPPPPGTDDN